MYCSSNRCAFKVAKDYIQFPNQIQQQEAFLQKTGFPLVLGCIDGTHVPIIAPSVNEEMYVCES